MSKATGSVASSSHSWVKLYIAVATLPLALAACGGGGGGGGDSPTPAPTPTPTPSPSPSPGASLALTASATTTVQGGSPITVTAAVTNSTGTPTWTLSGPGTLSATSGTSIQYTPPANGSITAVTPVTISAALAGATTQSVTVIVTLAPIVSLNWSSVAAPAAGNLLGVDFADSQYVAVSDSGAGLASTDAATWTPTTVFSSNVGTDHLRVNGVTHMGNTLVAVGSTSASPYTTSSAASAWSTDGTTWTMGAFPANSTPLHGVVAGNRFVGLGESGHLYSSTDGKSWSALTALSNAPVTFNSGVFGGGRYILVGDSGYIAASSDSVTWASAPVVKDKQGNAINLHGVTWTGKLYVAVGDNGAISTSANGSKWSDLVPSPISGSLRSIAVSTGGKLVIVGDNGVETSDEGTAWAASPAGAAAALNGVTFANGKFVAVGAGTAIRTAPSN